MPDYWVANNIYPEVEIIKADGVAIPMLISKFWTEK